MAQYEAAIATVYNNRDTTVLHKAIGIIVRN